MRIQFVSKLRPDGPVLFEAESQAIPRVGEYVTIPGYRETVVARVLRVFGDGGEESAAVVLG